MRASHTSGSSPSPCKTKIKIPSLMWSRRVESSRQKSPPKQFQDENSNDRAT